MLLGLVLLPLVTLVVSFLLGVVAQQLGSAPALAHGLQVVGGFACFAVPVELLAALVALLYVRGLSGQLARLGRLFDLMRRHGCDEATAQRITLGEVWEGMTEAMLIDARGLPVSRDQRNIKGRIRETWKYNQTGRGRFATRIIVNDGRVIGWDVKG